MFPFFACSSRATAARNPQGQPPCQADETVKGCWFGAEESLRGKFGILRPTFGYVWHISCSLTYDIRWDPPKPLTLLDAEKEEPRTQIKKSWFSLNYFQILVDHFTTLTYSWHLDRQWRQQPVDFKHTQTISGGNCGYPHLEHFRFSSRVLSKVYVYAHARPSLAKPNQIQDSRYTNQP